MLLTLALWPLDMLLLLLLTFLKSQVIVAHQIKGYCGWSLGAGLEIIAFCPNFAIMSVCCLKSADALLAASHVA